MKLHSLTASLFLATSLCGWAEVSFNRDIRPILSDTCYHCHGPDSANQYPKDNPLKLHTFEEATKDRGSNTAIVPGSPEKSDLIRRIFSKDDKQVMPPIDSHRSITTKQKELLKQWIAEGAKYEKHWAFIPPVKAASPKISNPSWIENEIDTFVLARLDEEKLKPNPETDRETLIRRATQTLTGFPPTPEEVDTFLADKSPDAYSKLLDRLLDSPHYGERMSLFWLEAARYADTDGYQNDGERTMWPWRDWVIKAFQDNMPFDEFSIKQLAGDMLPDNDVQDVLASAFNRNHRINNEGGALAEEFIVEYAIDRVETTGTIWMGLTAGCARCHDHKYDPLSQKEFYQFYGYFNNISEAGRAAGKNAPPQITISSPMQNIPAAQKLWELRAELSKAKATLRSKKQKTAWEKKTLADYRTLESSNWKNGKTLKANSSLGAKLTSQDDGSILSTGARGKTHSYDIEIAPHADLTSLASLQIEAISDAKGKFSQHANGNFVLSEVKLSIRDSSGKTTPVKFSKTSHSYSQKSYSAANLIDGKPSTGWAGGGYKKNMGAMLATLDLAKPITLAPNSLLIVRLEHTYGEQHELNQFRIQFSHSASSQDTPLFSALKAKKRNADQRNLILKSYENQDPEINRINAQIKKTIKAHKLREANVLVMKERTEIRPTYLLNRGLYSEPVKSEVLKRGVPAALNTDKPQPKDRLELARWLVSAENPLGARVTVNRIWQQHFGIGIVKTPDNFGLQGAAPSHPELLDWLAVDFIENGWDLKRLQKMILSSATWKQSSQSNAEMFERDPQNQLMARGPRFRLDASAIRDSALYSSGLLTDEVGGPPVKPYQPDGLWAVVAANKGTKYRTSKGKDLYRRGLYTYWKRAVNPPRMLIFDAATREYCSVGRNATNTPLQALALMNDVTFVEAARALAERMLKEGGTSTKAQLEYGFRLAVGNKPSPVEMKAMTTTYEDFKTAFTADPKSANSLLKQGSSQRDENIDPVEHAAMMMAAHLALNLDRSIHIE